MSQILYNVDDHIATITLNRPEALNAFNAEMSTAWAEAATRAAADDDVHAVIIRGAGRAFCAGGDVKAIHEMADRHEALTEMARLINTGLIALTEATKPVVAAAHGTTAGGGLGLLLSSDYAIVGEGSKIGSIYSRVGLTPDLSVSANLARTVGERRALALVLSHRMLSAPEALEWGLVAEVVADDDVAARAQEVAEHWLTSAHAYGQAKRLIRAGAYQNYREQLDDEARTIGEASTTPDAVRLMQAFIGS